MNTITIKDENLSGEVLNEFQLTFEKQHISVREIITSRVNAEVEAFNASHSTKYNGLVTPSDTEIILNGSKSIKSIDAEKQVYLALDGFLSNSFFMIVDNIQVEELDQVIELNPDSQVSFLKLTPLIGG